MRGLLVVSALEGNLWNSRAYKRFFVTIEVKDFSKISDYYGEILKWGLFLSILVERLFKRFLD